MAVFNPTTDIPAVVDSWEKLFVFAALGLESVSRDKEVVIRTEPGKTETRNLIELADFLDDANKRRLSIVAYMNIPLDADVSSGKLFSKVLSISNAEVGADYKTA